MVGQKLHRAKKYYRNNFQRRQNPITKVFVFFFLMTQNVQNQAETQWNEVMIGANVKCRTRHRENLFFFIFTEEYFRKCLTFKLPILSVPTSSLPPL